MRHFTLFAAGILFLAVTTQAGAAPLSPAGISQPASAIELVQEKKAKKDETLKQKAKRVWRNMTGYKFDVGCPSVALAFSRSTCTETGKNVSEARGKCRAKHPLCEIVEQSKGKKKS